ncbi:Fibrous sheath-interacting protein 2 [Tupaia chinensis]|uniref:Fibrous sheath-interacting protein 2 n=1 Tax=Tupaia chinensis TaxID=246437 RepID=L8YA98_TUPCH|nr:Fibrous sheath-interacting protein 2 [Tupaia chinensis]
MELQRPLSTDDTKNSTLRIKLPTAEMIKYAKDIVCMILETILSEFEKGKQNRAGVHAKAFSDQLMTAREIVNTVLKGLYASKDNLADPMKGSHSDNLRYSQDLSTLCLANPKAHFSLENVYSQLEKNFPKEGILKQMFDKWQIESPDIENEQYKLTMVAETALNEILIKAKELEYSVSLLNLSLPESCESRGHHNFQRYSSRVANSQMQICLFGQEVVEILSKKLEFFFLTQKFTVDYKEIQVNKKPALVATNNNAPTYNTKLKDKICLGSSHRIAQEIVEGVLNTLETFVDLQFNYVSTFSEIVRMPIENFSAIQHKTALRNILPKLQPLNKFPDESKSSTMISQENIEDCLQQLYSFHSELLTYATNAVNDMLGIIKNKLDQEKCQVEPSLISIVGENTVPSQIIKTLIEQCTHFYESLIKSHSKENPLPRAENTHVVNWARFPFPNRMEVPFSKLRSFSCQADLSQIPGLMFYSEESMKIKDRSSNLPSSVRYSAGDTSKTTEPVEELESQLKPSYSRIEIQHLSHFDQAMKGNSPLTKDSVLQKLFQKASASAQEHAWSFREIEDGENQRVFHLNQRQTTISPLKICPAVQNISTMPLSYGLPSSPPHTSSESMKTIKPVFLLKGKASSMVPEELKDKRSLLKIWERRISYESEKETKNLEANRDFTLLEKWNVKSPRIEKTATFEDIEVIAVMNQELELDEIHQIARYVTTDVFTHFKSFEIRGLPHSKAPLDEISNMIKDGEESHTSQKTPSSLGVGFYPNAFVEEIITRLLSKVFDANYNTEHELDTMTQKIVNSINNHFNEAKICILCGDQEQSLPTVDADTVDELVNSVYKNVLEQYGLDHEADNDELRDSDSFVENISNLIVAAISDYLVYPLFSGDLSASSYATLTAENIVQNISSGLSKSTKSHQHLSPYNTLLPYTVLENIIEALLTRVFPYASSMLLCSDIPEDGLGINFDELSSKLISDIRMKIFQHEIRFSKDEEKTNSVYSEDDAQHLVDSVLRNILQNCGSQETVEHDITSSNSVLIDRIAGFIIKIIFQQHLHPFVYGNLLPSPDTYFHDTRRQQFFASVYSSAFLEDVIFGVLSKIFERLLEITQAKSIKDSERELFKTAEELIYLITDEFSRAQICVLENAEEQLCLPPIERDVIIKIIDMVYSKVFQKFQLEFSNEGFLHDTKTLAEKVTKIILADIFYWQIHPDLIAKILFQLYAKLNADALIKRVHYDISKSRLQRQTCTKYTTVFTHTHLEKIVTQILSQVNPLDFSEEDTELWQSDFSSTVMKLIDEIMSIISKHAICITKHKSDEQSGVSEKAIQAMVDAIYADICHSELYQSLTRDRNGISSMPVAKIASYIIKEIFNHHLQSFLSEDKTFPPGTADQAYKPRARDPGQRELSFIVNSAVFLEEVISELLCKIFYVFSHNILDSENPCKAKAKITDTVTTVVKSIVLEFTKSQILVADNLDKKLYFSEGYEEMVKKIVILIYEKILEEYKSLIHTYRAIQSDAIGFGKKIYYLLLGEIYDYQVESLVSGELITSYSSLQEETIIRNILDTIYCKAKAKITDTVTTVVKSIVLEFTKSQILVADNLDKKLYFSEGYEEMVKKIVILIYEKILEEYKSLIHTYRAIQSDAIGFGKKIYYLLLGEIYDYQVESLVSGELITSYSSLQEETIIRNILDTIYDDSHSMPSCITVLPYSLLEDIIYKLLAYISPSSETATELKEEEVPLNYEFVNAASKLIDEIITEISEHEIRLATTEEHAESMQSEAIESLIDSVCNNITKNKKFQAEAPKDVYKKGDSLLRRIAGFIMKEIMDHHLRPFLCDEESSSKYLSEKDQATELSIPAKEKTVSLPQASVYSATFLEDVLIDLVRKFCTLPSVTENRKDKELSEQDLIGIAINFANALIEEFRENEIKVLAHAEETFSLPPVNEEIVGKISDSVYAEVMEIYGSGNVQKSDRSSFVTNTIAALVKKAMSAFSIQPLFSGDWSSTFFSF